MAKRVSISLPDEQFLAAQRLAESENRSLSELLQAALQHYQIARRREVTAEARQRALALGIREEDVPRIVKEWRREHCTYSG